MHPKASPDIYKLLFIAYSTTILAGHNQKTFKLFLYYKVYGLTERHQTGYIV